VNGSEATQLTLGCHTGRSHDYDNIANIVHLDYSHTKQIHTILNVFLAVIK